MRSYFFRWRNLVVCAGVVFVVWLLLSPGRQTAITLQIDSQVDTANELVDYAVLQSSIAAIDQKFLLPNNITISLRSCAGDANAYYDADSVSVLVCTELLEEFNSIFGYIYDNPIDIRDASTNAAIFIMAHELGHALIDILDIPITGREEDVADQLSAYILIETFPEGPQLVLDGANWFGVLSEQYDLDEMDFIGEHSLDVQRYYTLACWVYGVDPERFGKVVLEGGLPLERATSCESEYIRFRDSLQLLLHDYIR